LQYSTSPVVFETKTKPEAFETKTETYKNKLETPSLLLKLGLQVTLVTSGNEAATAEAPFARLHCTQQKRVGDCCCPGNIILWEFNRSICCRFSARRSWSPSLWAVLLTLTT